VFTTKCALRGRLGTMGILSKRSWHSPPRKRGSRQQYQAVQAYKFEAALDNARKHGVHASSLRPSQPLQTCAVHVGSGRRTIKLRDYKPPERIKVPLQIFIAVMTKICKWEVLAPRSTSGGRIVA
jgi:hypothetical protein